MPLYDTIIPRMTGSLFDTLRGRDQVELIDFYASFDMGVSVGSFHTEVSPTDQLSSPSLLACYLELGFDM